MTLCPLARVNVSSWRDKIINIKVDSRKTNKSGAKFSKAPRMGKAGSKDDVVSPYTTPFELHPLLQG